MEPTSHKLTVPRTAHYYRLGAPGPHIRRIWMVCHGYGQAAARFIQRFRPVASESDLILAPEGLSRFYWGGFDGPVVASWMTRGDRLDEIADYSNYLSQLLESYQIQCPADAELILLGFSQGTATQVRWIMRRFPQFKHLILWAGLLPEDIDYQPALPYFRGRSLHFFYAEDDPLLTAERLSFHRNVVARSGLVFEEHQYLGGHKVVAEELISQLVL